jgi:micrococcal nuclease
MQIKDFIKSHQQAIVLVIGYLLVASLGFGLGNLSAFGHEPPTILVEEVFTPQGNYNSNISSTQTQVQPNNSVRSAINCDGRIKGSSSMIYHMPGGSFYDRTTKPIRCFDTEAEAAAAGFRKSSR